MARQVRHRVTALVLGGLLLATPLLAGGTANAEQVEPGGRQVVFDGGGMLGLSCRSRPDVESLTVPSDSTIRLVNRTGYRARLMLGGQARGTVPDDTATEVVFRRGTTAVLLTPNCPMGQESTPVLVTATPSPVPTPSPPAGVPGVPTPTAPSDSPTATEEPSNRPPTGTTAPATPSATPTRQTPPAGGHPKPRPTRPTAAPVRTRTAAAAEQPPAPTEAPADDSAPAGQPRTTSRGTPAAAPIASDTPPADEPTKLSGVPAEVSSDPAPEPAAPGPAPTDVAAEQVSALEPIPEHNRIGLLAAVAAVCVIGVAVGAIRSIVSQRAYRAMIA